MVPFATCQRKSRFQICLQLALDVASDLRAIVSIYAPRVEPIQPAHREHRTL